MANGLSDNLHKVKLRIEEYGLSTAEYYKLRMFRSATKAAISLVNFMIFGIFLSLILVFLSLGLSIWLGKVLGSIYYGFLIIGGFYILVLICISLFGKNFIKSFMLLKFSGLFYDEFDPDVELGNSFTNDEKSVTLKDDNSVRLDKEMEKT